tara:strand:+ start:9400 stop:9687 length:288 start_codon:yes stop_codon:yes gene_type:complete
MSLDDIDSEDEELCNNSSSTLEHYSQNSTLISYFENIKSKTDNQYKLEHYDFIIQLLETTLEKIDTMEKYRKMVKGAGYKNPVGLLNHYRKASLT